MYRFEKFAIVRNADEKVKFAIIYHGCFNEQFNGFARDVVI